MATQTPLDTLARGICEARHEKTMLRRREDRAKRLHEIAAELRKTMRCNCALDKWEPERDTGHSFVCRIHKAAKAQFAADGI